MPKRGRPLKPGPRKPCGRLSQFIDEGHPMVLQHRAELVGYEHALSKYSDSVIGRLLIGGLLFDPGVDRRKRQALDQAQHRYDTLFEFAMMHFRLFGPGTAPSHLRNAIAGISGSQAVAGDADPLAGLYAKYRTWSAAAMIVPPGRSRILAHQILERATLYEMPPANVGELDCLTRVADRLGGLRGGSRPSRRGGENGGARSAPESRRDRMLAIFSRDRWGPSDDALARLKPIGEAD
jgi:hypothetical protein